MSACDCETPSVSEISTPIARKPHRCCECRKTIEVGEKYERVRGCWDGAWTTWITCSRCAALRAWSDDGKWCDCVPFGELVEWLEEWARGPRTDPRDPALAGWACGLVIGRWIREDDANEERRATWREKQRATPRP